MKGTNIESRTSTTLTPEEQNSDGGRMAAAIRSFVARSLAPLSSRVNALEASLSPRLATLELRSGMLALLIGRGAQAGKVAELEDLMGRVRELEARPMLSYGGTYTDGQQSNMGAFYTHRGSVWYCNRTTSERPGESPHFSLACKRGNDGRDASR